MPIPFIEERYWHGRNGVRDVCCRRANTGMEWTTEELRQRTGSPFCRGAVCRPDALKRHGIGKTLLECQQRFLLC